MINWKELWEDIKLEVWYYWSQIRDFFYDVYYFFVNIHIFWKDLKDFRVWDHEHCKNIYCTALNALHDHLYNDGHEVDCTRLKKVERIEELLMLLQMDLFDNLYDAYMPPKHTISIEEFNKMLNKAEKNRRDRICEILKGQDAEEQSILYKKEESKFKKYQKKHPHLHYTDNDVYEEIYTKIFDGTGAEGWWD